MSVSKLTRQAKMKVMSEAARKKWIAKAVKASKATHPVKIRGQTRHLPVIRVPLDFPLYRVDSNRTHDAQRLMVDKGIVEEGTFEKSHDSVEVQQAQHEILCEDGESNTERDKSLVEVFEGEELDESKPFNMTSDGRLVEIQATAEGQPFSRSETAQMLELAWSGIEELLALQSQALASTH